jgi:phage terminase large subunit
MLALTPKQSKAWLEILENPSIRRVMFDGGARSTKTALICAWLCVQAGTYPGARILIARKHRNAAEKSVWDDTLRKLLQGRRDFKMMDGDMEIHCPNGSLIRVDGLDDQDRVDKILGTEYAHIFFNEATQLSWQTITTVLTRLAQPVDGMPCRKALFDCNPKSQRHWLYKVGVLRVNPDKGEPLADSDVWARQSWTPYDNPYLPDDALKTLESLTGTQRRRMLDGVWCEAEGAVYDEFDDDIHVWHGAMPAGWEKWQKVRGIDFGYTNPFACLWGAIDPDGRLWIYRERYIRQQTVQVHAGAIKSFEPQSRYLWTVADHDAEDRATLHQAGIITLAARKDVERGIKAVKERLKVRGDGKPRLYIHESCKETIAEFFDYAWEQPREGKNEKEVPAKDRDHCMDSVRYIVMQLDCSPGGGIAIPGMI